MTETKADYVVSTAVAPTEKPWRCEGCGNILGYVVLNPETHIHELHLVCMDRPRLYWPVWEGNGRVPCECGFGLEKGQNEWFWGKDAMHRWMERRRNDRTE